MHEHTGKTIGGAVVAKRRRVGIARIRISRRKALTPESEVRSLAGEGHLGAQARKACLRAAKAAERAGLKVEWVRRLARRLTKLNENRAAVVVAQPR